MTEQQKDNIVALRRKGLNYPQIADEMGISVNTVKSFCRRYDANKGLCKNCGAPLVQIPKQKPKTFCTDCCRQTWWKRHPDQMKHRALLPLTCENCGREFQGYADAHRKYCCHACYIQHRYGVP